MPDIKLHSQELLATNPGQVPRALVPLAWPAQEPPPLTWGERERQRETERPPSHMMIWSNLGHSKIRPHVEVPLGGGCQVWPPSRWSGVSAEVCLNKIGSYFQRPFSHHFVAFGSHTTVPCLQRFSTDGSKRSLQQTTALHFFPLLSELERPKGKPQAPASCAWWALQNTSAPAITQADRAAGLQSQNPTTLIHAGAPVKPGTLTHTRLLSLSLSERCWTPEEFRAAHSAPERSHSVKPMLRPVRAHLLWLLKCSSLPLWVDLLKHW